jgi:hypothetical protein
VLGIPMGTNCAPALANLYLYSYESRFLDRLMAEGREDVARKFHMSFRYIDDALSLDNEHWMEFTSKTAEDGGIYPSALKLNDTTLTEEADAVHFLGMTIRNPTIMTQSAQGESRQGSDDVNVDRFYVEVFDKRKEFPFQVRRYPHMSSLIPTNLPYGVFIGQLHRYYNICSYTRDFLRHTIELGRTLFRQGCNTNRLGRHLREFLCKCQVRAANPNSTHHLRLRYKDIGRLVNTFKHGVYVQRQQPLSFMKESGN